jgi:GT2 family glycosyltransferase
VAGAADKQAETSTRIVDVVIVAHNAGDLLLSAAASAAEQAGSDAVWVVDAESTDGSIEKLRAAYPAVHIFPVPNDGFSASNNRGIELTGGSYVLLLNPDAELAPDALATLIATAEMTPRAAIVGPAVLNPDGTAQANSFGRFPSLITALGLRVQRAAESAAGNSAHSPVLPARAKSVDWVTGAAMLVRRAAIEDAGMMDEGFFLYYEDTEWCHRMRDHGWDVILEPAAKVIHHLGTAGAPKGRVAEAYRASFYRYCDLYGLWGLKGLARVGVAARSALGGRS